MKKWIGLGAALLVVLAVTGTLVFNNKVEQTQGELEGVDRSSKGKDSELHAADTEENENKAEAGAPNATSETGKTGKDAANSKTKNEDAADGDNNSTSRTEKAKNAADKTESSAKNKDDRTKQTNTTGTSPSGSSKPSATNNQSANAIMNQYEAEFRAMEGKYESQLNGLIQQAYEEYMNEGSVNQGKYKSKAASLQSTADSEFYSTYSQLKSDLERNGHNPSQASKFKSIYEGKKAAKRDELESFVQ
ncbi:hypothetical protein [Bacillus piscicola]|uniref:hypothetical protein n=1 Tax=Bacillus piscicola TaxID=1632684 RepID=UPI001F094426|nr:hypothetical protein [Bacillus piscicola]